MHLVIHIVSNAVILAFWLYLFRRHTVVTEKSYYKLYDSHAIRVDLFARYISHCQSQIHALEETQKMVESRLSALERHRDEISKF